jgi:hypothetical protein
LFKAEIQYFSFKISTPPPFVLCCPGRPHRSSRSQLRPWYLLFLPARYQIDEIENEFVAAPKRKQYFFRCRHQLYRREAGGALWFVAAGFLRALLDPEDEEDNTILRNVI